jgi:exo-1,4-beta-D-glucosaminidase
MSGLSHAAMAKEVILHEGWTLQSACKLTDSGALISSAAYHPAGWLMASVPSTVLAAQVAAGIYKDIYFGMNLRSIPGTDYPIGTIFSKLPMPADSPYRCGWWYRKQFVVPAGEPGNRFSLQFDGINYSADIWLNGRRVADQSAVRGAYRTYEFDVSRDIHPGATNVVAIEVFPPAENSLAMNWVDWNPMPPDKDMGLWGSVRLVSSGPVTVRHTAVFTHFEDDTLATALLTVTADLHNASDDALQGEAVVEIAGRRLSQNVRIAPGGAVTLQFRPDQYAELRLFHPRIWWPADYGDQPLQNAAVRFIVNARVSDQEVVRYGVREVTSEFTPQGHRMFRINGKPILIRGGGWTPDMLLRDSRERLLAQFDLARDLHLNTLRLEGKLESEDFFRLADERGVFVLAGWCCCDFWEEWENWSSDDLNIAAASLESQMLRLRSHPSLLGWMYGSDNPPPAEVENRYREVIPKVQWPNPVMSSASATPTSVTGVSGVKMTGPYDYVPPSYWYQDTSKYGGAFGFITETGPGAAPEQVSELKKFLPESALWPPDNPTWDFHAGGGEFKNVSRFNRAMNETYGPAGDVETYARIAQTMTYDGERAMFEAYSGRRYVSTGVIQWLLNNAWPSLIWHLYDYYLVPGGGYYGAKKANEPLHIQYAYDQHQAVVVNSTLSDTFDMEAKAEAFASDLKPVFSKSVSLPVVRANSAQPVIDIPQPACNTGAQFCYIRLTLAKAGGVTVSRNFYWLPVTPATFDWAKTTFFHTPVVQPEVMTDLRKLEPATLSASADVQGGELVVRVANHSQALAFQLAAEAFDNEGNLLPMLLWNDNYIELMPGESSVLSAAVPHSYKGSTLKVRLSGWNVAPWERTLPVTSKPVQR